MTRTSVRLRALAAGAAVPFVILGAATPPAYADDVATDDVEIGPDVEVGPTVEISPAGTAVLPDEIWAMIDEGSTLQPPPN
ncbi:MAG: hypothetical protein QOC62_560 [Mycobacterium sp.]|jgi:hypothetical protein|nr:hypothetical protein [Mycobacterium sp.]